MNSVAVLRPARDGFAHPVLESLDIQAHIQDVFSRVTMVQEFRNVEGQDIEAVYTFPLPLHAQVMSLRMELGAKALVGTIKGKRSTEQEYEDAVSAGNAACLLEQLEPGLYSINVGNIRAGESVRVTLIWSEILDWAGNRLEFRIPTVSAPRYGPLAEAGMDERSAPTYAPANPIKMRFQCVVAGVLAEADCRCPTHPLARNVDGLPEGAIAWRIESNKLIPDRDIVLRFTTPVLPPAGLLACRDGNQWLLVSRSQPKMRDVIEQDPSRNLIILLDCSGSMAGDSIAQARLGLRRVLMELGEHDRFTIIRFGSDVDPIHTKLVNASERALEGAAELVQSIEADLGGTDLQKALQLSWDIADQTGDATVDVLLITDGHVTRSGTIAKQASRHGRRIFSIGVGSNVTERTVRELSEQTGGACELVTPRDDIDDRMVCMFRRIRNPRQAMIGFDWPGQPSKTFSRLGDRAFEGDTVLACAWYSEMPQGIVRTVTVTPGNQASTQEVPVSDAQVTNNGENETEVAELSRLVAGERIRQLRGADGDAQEGEALAIKYQLISPWTNCIAVLERQDGDLAGGAPALSRVQQAFPAGVGGFGTVRTETLALSTNLEHISQFKASKNLESREFRAGKGPKLAIDMDDLRHQATPDLMRIVRESSTDFDGVWAVFLGRLHAFFKERLQAGAAKKLLSSLAGASRPRVPEFVLDQIDRLVEEMSEVVSFKVMVPLSRGCLDAVGEGEYHSLSFPVDLERLQSAWIEIGSDLSFEVAISGSYPINTQHVGTQALKSLMRDIGAVRKSVKYELCWPNRKVPRGVA